MSLGACPIPARLPTRVLVPVFSYEMQSLGSMPSEQAFPLVCTSLGPQGRRLTLRLQKMAVYNPERHLVGARAGLDPTARPAFPPCLPALWGIAAACPVQVAAGRGPVRAGL